MKRSFLLTSSKSLWHNKAPNNILKREGGLGCKQTTGGTMDDAKRCRGMGLSDERRSKASTWTWMAERTSGGREIAGMPAVAPKICPTNHPSSCDGSHAYHRDLQKHSGRIH